MTTGAGMALSLQDRIGLRVTRVVGTMWCAYVFALFAFGALPEAIMTRSPMCLVNWASSNFIQLVLLPIIIVGQNLEGKRTEARAEADYEFSRRFEEFTKKLLASLEDNELRQSIIMGRMESIVVDLRLRQGMAEEEQTDG